MSAQPQEASLPRRGGHPVPTDRRCRACGQVKPIEQFRLYEHKHGREWAKKCIACCPGRGKRPDGWTWERPFPQMISLEDLANLLIVEFIGDPGLREDIGPEELGPLPPFDDSPCVKCGAVAVRNRLCSLGCVERTGAHAHRSCFTCGIGDVLTAPPTTEVI